MTHAELKSAGHGVDEAAYARLAGFVRCLLDENTRVNLTAIRDEAEVWKLHVCDSLALLPLIDASGTKTLLDIGTGGGAPGLPLACARPKLSATLLDATRKKTEAVWRIIRSIHVDNATVVWGRAEVLASERKWPRKFDAVTARAVAPLVELLAYAAPFLRPGGWAWFFKSTDIEEEMKPARPAARRLGFRMDEAHRYTLPGASSERIIVRFRFEPSRGSGERG